jgi:ribosomal protein S2
MINRCAWIQKESHTRITPQPQWCPGGLTRSQKRHVQRLRQLEIIEEEQEQTLNKKGVKSQVWRVKPKADDK